MGSDPQKSFWKTDKAGNKILKTLKSIGQNVWGYTSFPKELQELYRRCLTYASQSDHATHQA